MTCDPQHSWKYVLGVALWQGLEHWLGRTERVRAGSTPALLFNAVEWTLVSLYHKIKRKESP